MPIKTNYNTQLINVTSLTATDITLKEKTKLFYQYSTHETKRREGYKFLIRTLYYGTSNLGVLLEAKWITVNEILKRLFHFTDNTK